ncbi:hypothetical protein JCGZ_16685 [Jatropha curcas]|uniref:Uncharacterized protein n=1 Tax=Jatropha curcas TaxID=180498 RepID=A0A067KEI6_JATCU|nr:hypothetical protein JCGZ_16685 [Jatropha curcas]
MMRWRSARLVLLVLSPALWHADEALATQIGAISSDSSALRSQACLHRFRPLCAWRAGAKGPSMTCKRFPSAKTVVWLRFAKMPLKAEA